MVCVIDGVVDALRPLKQEDLLFESNIQPSPTACECESCIELILLWVYIIQPYVQGMWLILKMNPLYEKNHIFS